MKRFKHYFILVNGKYEEIPGSEFEQNASLFQNRYFLPFSDSLMEVAEDDYKRHYTSKRRNKYIREEATRVGEVSIHANDTATRNGESVLADSSADTIEERIEEQELKNLLRKAVSRLSQEEQKLVRKLYVEGKTEREYARELGISQSALHKRKQRILQILKKYF